MGSLRHKEGKEEVNTKTISFGQWKTWVASRLIDLDRRIHILKEAKDYVENKEELWKTLVSLCSQKLWIESIVRRASSNDTVDIIARDMKKKALMDIDKWENGNAD